jgi:hypothetical protein
MELSSLPGCGMIPVISPQQYSALIRYRLVALPGDVLAQGVKLLNHRKLGFEVA